MTSSSKTLPRAHEHRDEETGCQVRVAGGARCGMPILANTEEWETPMCADHYELTRSQFERLPVGKVKVQAP